MFTLHFKDFSRLFFFLFAFLELLLKSFDVLFHTVFNVDFGSFKFYVVRFGRVLQTNMRRWFVQSVEGMRMTPLPLRHQKRAHLACRVLFTCLGCISCKSIGKAFSSKWKTWATLNIYVRLVLSVERPRFVCIVCNHARHLPVWVKFYHSRLVLQFKQRFDPSFLEVEKVKFCNFRVWEFCCEICLSFLVEICNLNPSAPNHLNSKFRKLRLLLVHLLLALDVKECAVYFLSLLLICLPLFVFKKHRLRWWTLTNLIFWLLYPFCGHSFLIFPWPKNLIFYIHLVW